jgi:hypothetical protein
MARKTGQIITRGQSTWLVRVYLSALTRLVEAKLFIGGTAAISIAELLSKATRLKSSPDY